MKLGHNHTFHGVARACWGGIWWATFLGFSLNCDQKVAVPAVATSSSPFTTVLGYAFLICSHHFQPRLSPTSYFSPNAHRNDHLRVVPPGPTQELSRSFWMRHLQKGTPSPQVLSHGASSRSELLQIGNFGAHINLTSRTVLVP